MTALDYIKFCLEADSEPILSTEELNMLVELAKSPDNNGTLPTQSGWNETYDFPPVILLGWKKKYAKAVSAVDIKNENLYVYYTQIAAHCKEMITEWSAAACYTSEVECEYKLVNNNVNYYPI